MQEKLQKTDFRDQKKSKRCKRLEFWQHVALHFPNVPRRPNDVRNRIYSTNFRKNFRDRRVRRSIDRSTEGHHSEPKMINNMLLDAFNYTFF